MIIPVPEKLSLWQRFPATCMLLTLNVVLFFMFFAGVADQAFRSDILKRENLALTGKIYKDFQVLVKEDFRSRLPRWILEFDSRSNEHMVFLGAMALRDRTFMELASSYAYAGDQVAIGHWKKIQQKYYADSQDQVLYKFGLSMASSVANPLTWVTYQFSHSTWIHLLSNMMLLLTLGMAVEAIAGGGLLLGIYLMGGFAGGLAFLGYDIHGTIPMVGASAGVSAIMGFYTVIETKKRIRYYYFFSPFQGHYGFIYMPTLLIIPLFLIVDFAQILANPGGISGGVAYIAHVAGCSLGLLSGILFRLRQRSFVAHQ